MKSIWLGLVILLSSSIARADNTRICVSVQHKSWSKSAKTQTASAPATPNETSGAPPLSERLPADQPTASAPPAPSAAAPPSGGPPPPLDGRAGVERTRPPKPQPNPHALDPTLYLQRMLEYEVTHEPGFVAVESGCPHRLAVELYPLERGWTIFARYSGTEREEKVDRAELDEFPELAQRIAFALLRRKSIQHTITRENVLRADSEVNLRTIDGTGHLVFGMGTEVRMARLPTAQGQLAEPRSETRILTPVSLQVGYRRKLRAWGLDAFGRVNLGTENTGIRRNDLGGHVDYAWSVMAGLHFLHYLDAPGVNSFYFGGGAAFELAVFESIQPIETRFGSNRDSLVGGGLNLDLLAGYEFMRTSSVHFFGQVEINAPTYLVKTEKGAGSINTYMPGAVAQIGVIF